MAIRQLLFIATLSVTPSLFSMQNITPPTETPSTQEIVTSQTQPSAWFITYLNLAKTTRGLMGYNRGFDPAIQIFDQDHNLLVALQQLTYTGKNAPLRSKTVSLDLELLDLETPGRHSVQALVKDNEKPLLSLIVNKDGESILSCYGQEGTPELELNFEKSDALQKGDLVYLIKVSPPCNIYTSRNHEELFAQIEEDNKSQLAEQKKSEDK